METKWETAPHQVAQAVSLLCRRLAVGAAVTLQKSMFFSDDSEKTALSSIVHQSCPHTTTRIGVVPFQVIEYQRRSCPVVPDRAQS